MFCSPFNPLSRLAKEFDMSIEKKNGNLFKIPLRMLKIEHYIEEVYSGQGHAYIMTESCVSCET